jgi:hypothetical protein
MGHRQRRAPAAQQRSKDFLLIVQPDTTLSTAQPTQVTPKATALTGGRQPLNIGRPASPRTVAREEA